MTTLRNRFRNKGGAAEIISSLGWNGDLSALPSLEFDPSLAVGCTEAQALAALSIDSGALVINTADAVSAGAATTWEAVWWLGDPVKDPLDFFWRSEMLSSVITVNILSVGIGAFYLEDGENIGSNPPGASAPWFGYGVTAWHKGYIEGFGDPPTSLSQSTHRAVHSNVSRFPSASHAESRGTSYASLPGFYETIKDPREVVDGIATPEAARFRPAISVQRLSGNGQLTVRIDELSIKWQP